MVCEELCGSFRLQDSQECSLVRNDSIGRYVSQLKQELSTSTSTLIQVFMEATRDMTDGRGRLCIVQLMVISTVTTLKYKCACYSYQRYQASN